ncbi:hypothetical protein EIN_164340 [Entamoeba invadens IP1]|uniref:TLDc domain-containing protein n=1 Tax=Entamoeba invadens IP1 TaxID=370355 RepID=A0A0A1UA65_ENTIV|nr:hypothetical protein EIN_164340 [Entamoeba invadens IP1]ELP89034.1 hypothetical protein EIN_164340 [Entamoeba invadens IP1]|eukprot:XP_004255805.1 hypothetical protein EIN_164340 [Entamoeba invadens IP1]
MIGQDWNEETFKARLKEWTQLEHFNTLYDSDVDGWEYSNLVSILNKKTNTMALCFSSSGLVFGSFLRNPIIPQFRTIDPNFFIFFLKTPSGLPVPAKFQRTHIDFKDEPCEESFVLGGHYFFDFFSIRLEYESVKNHQQNNLRFNEYTYKFFQGFSTDYFGVKLGQYVNVVRFIFLQWY